MRRYLGAMMIVMGLMGAAFAAETTTTTSKPATPACCGEKCQKMGANCCKTDAAGKTTCAMGGSCCVKP